MPVERVVLEIAVEGEVRNLLFDVITMNFKRKSNSSTYE